MLLDLTPDDLTDDAAMRRAAIRLAPTMPLTADQLYGLLCDLAHINAAMAWEPPDATDFAEAQAPPRPDLDYRRGLRRPWWERR